MLRRTRLHGRVICSAEDGVREPAAEALVVAEVRTGETMVSLSLKTRLSREGASANRNLLGSCISSPVLTAATSKSFIAG
ncbi:MAG: hypothetical protein U0990_10405 [Candidatus Nanopelagicales bacterium]|nr:hypothetical protein [Candidatus Nanopelagicales bacterium]MDZ4250486.1 hypothetical protein [Candidatus Nanopelagicales bacterium]MDZ7578182.1 hypothetical protein [Candidatus Nanopelagicales bacterium]